MKQKIYLLILCLLLTLSDTIAQQTSKISGKIVDASGEPIIGATIVEKGKPGGAMSDAEGQFSLNVTDPNATLVITSVEYKTLEVALNKRTFVEIKLEQNEQLLNELIVVGYGTQKKSDLTGAVSRISMENTPVPNVSISQALSGASAGINIQQTGMAGGNASISIRGQSSLSANDNPLIVLDGIIFNGSISEINVNDVEFIDVLKDASSAAVYGSRSANGVIIITTKKGKTGKPKISLNYNHGFQEASNSPMRVMNAEEYAVRLTDYYYQQNLYNWYKTNPTSADGKPVRPDITDRNVVAKSLRTQEERDNYLKGNEIDWVSQVLRSQAQISNADLSFSGRTDRVNYYISGSRTYEEGVLKNDQFERYTFNTKVDGKVNSWLSVGMNINYSYRDYSGLNANLGNARFASPLANNDLSHPDNYVTFLTGENYMPHPLGPTKALNEDIRNSLFFVTNAKIEVPFIKGLTYDFNYSNTFYTRKNNVFYPETIEFGNENKGRAEKMPEEQRSWIINNIFNYARTFNKHSINGTFLYSREKYHGENLHLRVERFENPILGFNNLNLGTTVQIIPPSSGQRAWEEMGTALMGRINYVYNDRYFLTATVRRDGFSGFGPNSKFVTLPSLSLGWTFTEEPIFNMPNYYGKLRLSYGLNGNQGIGRYSSFAQMGTNNYVYGSTTAIAVYPNTLGNQSLAWEKTSALNLGLDFGFIKNRITGSIDVYTGKTSDVLVRRKLPASSGYGDIWANIGQLTNKGIDFELRTKNIVNKPFTWNSTFTFSLVRDKITKLYGGENDMDIGNSWFVGHPISAIYDYKKTGGLWTEQELYNKTIIPGWYPGQYKYEDINGDNKITPESDRTIIGYKAPNYRFSIGNTLNYKNFSFYFLLNSIQGGNGYYQLNNYTVVNVSERSDDVLRVNQSAVRPYWTPDNGVNNATGVYNAPAQQSGIYEDRSFVRLQDVSLTYTFPSATIQKMGIGDLQLFVSAKNAYVWTKWSGWDPEIASANSNYPAMRNYTFGARLSF